ncbi:arginine-fifty homeobox [Dasypus novemcinctus]|uniref:arginine-fifty homeobox n=1 Tax=Dasypus novemcinctus TaxID=9361 RepID=UPI000328BD07|nr:arginine-fifty homeobox [Dasypus novemcinctus]
MYWVAEEREPILKSVILRHRDIRFLPSFQKKQTIWRKPYDRTLFSHKQHEELEALFRETMFPDKNIRKELALKLNIDESRVKVWFRNRRFKMKKQQQQQQQSLTNPNQILQAKKNVSPSPRASTNPYSLFPVVSHSYSSLPPQPLDTSNWAWDSVFPEYPTSNVHIQYPQLESLMATVPALFPDDYNISQIMDLYSFPDDEISSSSFSCLYQYLSPKRPQPEQGNTLSNFAGPGVGLAPERAWSSMTSQGFDAFHVRHSMGFQFPSSMVDYGYLYQSTNKYQALQK